MLHASINFSLQQLFTNPFIYTQYFFRRTANLSFNVYITEKVDRNNCPKCQNTKTGMMFESLYKGMFVSESFVTGNISTIQYTYVVYVCTLCVKYKRQKYYL